MDKFRNSFVVALVIVQLTHQNLHGQEGLRNCFNLRADIQLMHPLTKVSSSTKIINPLKENYYGGFGSSFALDFEKNWKKQFLLLTMGISNHSINGTILYQEVDKSSSIYELNTKYKFRNFQAEVSIGHSFLLQNKSTICIDVGLGYIYLLNRNAQEFVSKIYDPVAEKNNYFEMNSTFRRNIPLTGKIRVQLNFPFYENRLGIAIQYTALPAVYNTYEIRQVVGMDYRTIPPETGVILNRNISIGFVYKFSYKLTKKSDD